MAKDNNYKQGSFTPKNRNKYSGRYPIKFKSLLELKFCMYIDNNPSIVEWKYEPFSIPYIHPIDGKEHIYWPDFLLSIIPKDGSSYKALVEVKPFDLTPSSKSINKMNKRGGESANKFKTELLVNAVKFKEGEIYCTKRGWKWLVLTERDITSKGL